MSHCLNEVIKGRVLSHFNLVTSNVVVKFQRRRQINFDLKSNIYVPNTFSISKICNFICFDINLGFGNEICWTESMRTQGNVQYSNMQS